MIYSEDTLYLEDQRPKGAVQRIIKYKDGKTDVFYHKNVVLTLGRMALASSLANEISSTYDYFISRMLFGDGGTADGVPKYVTTNRNGLFGITRAVQPVLATIDPNCQTQVTFTSILDYDDANGFALSEMALQMNNGNFYSMTTFPDLSKTSNMQVTWNWRLSFV